MNYAARQGGDDDDSDEGGPNRAMPPPPPKARASAGAGPPQAAAAYSAPAMAPRPRWALMREESHSRISGRQRRPLPMQLLVSIF